MENSGKKQPLSPDYWIVKSNTLNEIRNSRMTISQTRLFAIYLSKINPMDVASREVILKLQTYTQIMEFKQTNTTRLVKTAEELMKLTVTFFNGNEQNGLKGFTTCPLFKRFKLEKDEQDEWIVKIDCHDDVVRLLFELKKHFFKYRLWNALQLPSPNQNRMYEILKQYEYVGAREVTLKDLREFLGIKTDEYKDWDNFRRRVLEPAQQSLASNTDIKFTWEPVRKRGYGGKIDKLKFYIEKNKAYEPPLSFDEFLTQQAVPVFEDEPKEFEHHCTEEAEAEEAKEEAEAEAEETGDYFSCETYPLMNEACDNEFNKLQIQVLYNLVLEIVPFRSGKGYELDMFHYLKSKHDELRLQASEREIKSRFGYLKKMIESDLGREYGR